MTAELSAAERAKFAAARRAVDFVENGMRLGLGTGTTAAWMVRCLAARMRDEGLSVTGVATSSRTAQLATALGVPIKTLDDVRWLDLTIDGADEYDAKLNLIKGGGGALLQEKIVATASDRMMVIADPSKQVDHLGAFPLPVEVIPFGWQTTSRLIEAMLAGADVLGRSANLRSVDGVPFRTDEGNFILDLHLGRIADPAGLSLALNQIPGVVENGLFLDICDIVVIGDADGMVDVRDKHAGTSSRMHIDLSVAPSLLSDPAP